MKKLDLSPFSERLYALAAVVADDSTVLGDDCRFVADQQVATAGDGRAVLATRYTITVSVIDSPEADRADA